MKYMKWLFVIAVLFLPVSVWAKNSYGDNLVTEHFFSYLGSFMYLAVGLMVFADGVQKKVRPFVGYGLCIMLLSAPNLMATMVWSPTDFLYYIQNGIVLQLAVLMLSMVFFGLAWTCEIEGEFEEVENKPSSN